MTRAGQKFCRKTSLRLNSQTGENRKRPFRFGGGKGRRRGVLLKGVAVVLAVVLAVSCAWTGTQGAQAYSAPTTWDDLSTTGYRPTDGITSFTSAYNNLTIDNVSITSGSDAWELKDAGSGAKMLCWKTKVTSTGKKSLKALTIRCKNSVKTVDGQMLNVDLVLTPTAYISANASGWNKNDILEIALFRYNTSSKKVTYIGFESYLLTAISASGITKEGKGVPSVRITTQVKMLNQDGTTYNPTNRCAYYRFDDLDGYTRGWNSTGSTYKYSYTDYTNIGDGTGYNEGVQFKSGVQSINVQKTNYLTISDSYSKYVAKQLGDNDSKNEPTNAVAVKANASGFSFVWQGVYCGTGILGVGNYVQYRLVVKKSSSDSTYTRSRAGAVYGVYSDAACKSLLYSATCDEDGTAYVLEDGRALVYDTTYYLKEITAAPGYALDTSVYPFDAVNIYSYVTKGANTYDDLTVSVADDPLRMPFSFTKTDSVDGALAGVTFSLVQTEGGTISKSVTSTAAGLVDFGNLNQGTYTLTETAAPQGYEASSGSWTVVVDGEAKTVTVTANDGAPAFTGSQTAGWKLANAPATVPFSFAKVDATDASKVLSGAVFNLKGVSGTVEAKAVDKTVTSTAAGLVDFGELYHGGYTLTETVAPYGYVKAEGSWTVTVDADAGTVTVAATGGAPAFSGTYAGGDLSLANEKSPTLPFSFTKTGEDGATPLANATFELYACGDTSHTSASDHSWTATNDASCCWDVDDPVAVVTTGADGLADFGELPDGQYMLVETVAPSGYRLPHGQWLVAADLSTTTVSIEAHAAKDASGNVTGDLPPAFKKDAETGAYSVANYKKWTLPLAGGTGIIAFTAAGAALVAAALVWLLLARRKKRAA